MKSLFTCILVVSVFLLNSGCNGPKERSDNQESVTDDGSKIASEPSTSPEPVTSGNTSPGDSSSATVVQEVQATAAAGEKQSQDMDTKKNNLEGGTLTGKEAIDFIIGKLNNKLSLEDSQIEKINGLITKSYLDGGHDLSQSYPKREITKIVQGILKANQEQIGNVLNEDQRKRFDIWMTRS